MLKGLLAAATALALSGFSAQAAIVTINFEANRLTGDAEAFAALGISTFGSLTGSFTYDDGLPDGQGTSLDGQSVYGYDDKSSMTTSVNGVDLTGSADDYVFSRDGFSRTSDVFRVYNYDAFNGLAGVTDSLAYILVDTLDPSVWSGLGRTAEDLNAASSRYFNLALAIDGGIYSISTFDLNFSAPAVPLPAGAPLLLTGLAGLALIRRRARRAA